MCERSAAADYLHQNIPPLQSCCCNYNALRCARPNQRLLQPAVTHTHTHTRTNMLRQIAFAIIRLKWYYGKKEVGCVGNFATPRRAPPAFLPLLLPSFLPAILALFLLLLLLLLKTKQNNTISLDRGSHRAVVVSSPGQTCSNIPSDE